ncbi:alpha/beta fold hydrolase [Stenotrophomonas sp. HITSZ_GD]|uniref:alpha/beta fold hydrolase n=1 Tax=Stenotrophomonas sp. HITSZ_GD TaxID=3037248 RepID=UPI00240D9143|nr:alpha/beta fold hydrolase [Stenotrophomonas sp. HITSZ_GD]MDG2526690.1 alpha/beta fold hydrolase [Stenotrophomonas sp. HITSZ_GD]
MSTRVQAGTASGTATAKRPRGLTLLRMAMRALARISPTLASWGMDRLWFRAPRTHPDAAARACLAQGRHVPLTLHGKSVAAWTWGEQGPWVLLMHGWGGHAGQLHAFVPPLLAAGFRVAAFDAPAHGASAGSRHGRRRVTFFEFADALRALASHLGPLHGVIAHSGGCTALALAMRQGWQAPRALVFVAPFCEPQAAIDGFARQLGVAGETVARFTSRVSRWLGIEWSDLEIAALPAEVPRDALLVVHDSGDREVPLAQSQRLVAGWPGARLVVTHGAGHRRLLALPQVADAAAGFLAERQRDPAPRRDYRPADSRGELDRAFEATARFWRRRRA